MRLWSLHPRYLDRQGLLALWREALLAQAVLRGETRGYRHHPQLERFVGHPEPLSAISTYLRAVFAEAVARGYAFDEGKIKGQATRQRLTVSDGQLAFEWSHLMAKLQRRNPERFREWRREGAPEAHPLFRVAEGGVASWEKVS